jgi:hypothetical protein
MTKPNRRAGHHRSYAQINPFPFKFYGPPHVLPKSQKNKKGKACCSEALGEDLDSGGGAHGGGVGARREPQRRVRGWRGPRWWARGGDARRGGERR